jgi:hypothetical protein
MDVIPTIAKMMPVLHAMMRPHMVSTRELRTSAVADANRRPAESAAAAAHVPLAASPPSVDGALRSGA